MSRRDIKNILDKIEANIIHQEVDYPSIFANSRYDTLTEHLRQLKTSINDKYKYGIMLRKFLERPQNISMGDYYTIICHYKMLPVYLQRMIGDKQKDLTGKKEYMLGMEIPLIHQTIKNAKNYPLGYANLIVLWENFQFLTYNIFTDNNITPFDCLITEYNDVRGHQVYGIDRTIGDWIDYISLPAQ